MTLYELGQLARTKPREKVTLIKREKNFETGERTDTREIKVLASVAFKALSKDFNKRSQVWQNIELPGQRHEQKIVHQIKIDTNSLSDPNLLQALLANPEVMAKLQAAQSEALKPAEPELAKKDLNAEGGLDANAQKGNEKKSSEEKGNSTKNPLANA
jgi:hypothetical protein